MKQESLHIRCVFREGGEDLQQLILHSFSLYLHRTLTEDGVPGFL